MPEFDITNPATVDRELCKIILAAPLPGLDSSPRSETTATALEDWIDDRSNLLPESLAGLWLLAGELDRSHTLSQSITSPEGSFWHGIMHRREGDFWNAKYWFQRTTGHPVHDQLAQQIRLAANAQLPVIPCSLLQPATNESWASILVDCCQQAQGAQPHWREPLERICWWEWQLLFQHCLAKKSRLAR